MLIPSGDLSTAVLDSLSAHVAVLDRDGIIIAVNRAWTCFAVENGNPGSVGVGASYLEVLQRTQGEARAEALHVLQGLREVQCGRAQEFTHEYSCHSPSERRWYLLRATPLGTGAGLVTAHERTTESKLLEERLQEQTEIADSLYRQAQARNRTQDEFLAIMSHELRQPLNTILGWTQLLRMGNLPAERARHGIAVIERSVRAQAQIISDLLDISRITTGKLNVEMTPISVLSCITAALESVRFSAEAKSLHLLLVEERADLWVLGDAVRLQQVIINLLLNSIKFTPAGGRIEVGLSRRDSRACIRVSDSGIGIAAELLPHVFQRFWQADNRATRRGHGGFGLGLAIVQHLVALHQGSVHAESAGEGQGATFIVELPLASRDVYQSAPAAPAVPPAVDEQKEVEPVAQLGGLKVLVVDDEADSRNFAVWALGRFGAQAIAVGSAGEATEAFKHWHPDVLVSDIGMPGEDGYDLIKTVRALEKEHGGHIPAVAMTAFARKEDRERCLAAGFQRHLPKPIEAEHLVRIVSEAAGREGRL